MLVFAVAAGAYGWHQRGELVKRGSFNEPHRPAGVSRESHARMLSRWRQRRRLYWTLLYAFVGAMTGFVLLAFIHGAAGLMGR